MFQFSPDPATADRQTQALIFFLTAFGYIDGNFDISERIFVRDYIKKLVDARVATAQIADPQARDKWAHDLYEHFIGVFNHTDQFVRELFNETLAAGEDLNEFVYGRLKLRTFEIIKGFTGENQRQLVEAMEGVIAADGIIHPAEAKFRSEVNQLLAASVPAHLSGNAVVDTTVNLKIKTAQPQVSDDNHPIFERIERPYSSDPTELMHQAAKDYQLMTAALEILDKQRRRGQGRLAGKRHVSEMAGETAFLDDFIYVVPPDSTGPTELTVLGDLHGCYSCLKAAVLQSGFLSKVRAYQEDQTLHPKPLLVLLGDYIDRGIYSLEGTLRGALSLFVEYPEHVYLLRGNHEYFVERGGTIMSGVLPAEAINTWLGPMPVQHFQGYKRLFDNLPGSLFFDRILFTHAGIPKDRTLSEEYVDLSSLNSPRIRFEMMWSDPSDVDYVPANMQDQNARFPFGRMQLRAFMSLVGCN
ncbi:MAG: metallophosphoesterase, partial [Myxococcales bacterium]|nr:metallophosphoesterase [Myxococcales bacterium]